jgi:glycosyltransferase involved in cell wall biosynthesis
VLQDSAHRKGLSAGRRRILFISYAFPPVGGAGVQRAVKFVKYLPAFGWEASVLTVANPSVPVLDHSLETDVPSGTIVRRARTFEPGYAVKAAISAGAAPAGGLKGILRRWARGGLRRLSNLLLQPDAQILWKPRAVQVGMNLLQEIRHDAIVATGPPFSSFLVGAVLSKRTGLPLVLDYRDEWDLSSQYLENQRRGLLARLIQQRMQRKVVRAASALLASTRSSAQTLETVQAKAGGGALVSWIYNGFDPDDFAGPVAKSPANPGPYRLVYLGTLWELTSAAPLVEAVRRLALSDPAALSSLELVFAGRRTSAQDDHLARLVGLPCRVTAHTYLDHARAVDLIRGAGGLCAILSDLPGADRVVPAKIFEYMAVHRPILVIAPRGELWDLLKGHPRAHCFTPGDVEGIAGCLAQEVRQHSEEATWDARGWDPSCYDRRRQAAQLAELLTSLRQV